MNRLIKRLLFFVALMLFIGNVLAADVRVAFVNTAQILEQVPQAEASREKLQGEFAPRDDALISNQKKLKSLEEKLARDSAVMTEDSRRELERDILGQQRELARARDEFAEDLNIRRNEEFAKLQRLVVDTIVRIAKEDSYDLVLEAGVVYASDKVDITDKLISRLKQQFTPQ